MFLPYHQASQGSDGIRLSYQILRRSKLHQDVIVIRLILGADTHQIAFNYLVHDNQCTFGVLHPFSLRKGLELHRLRQPFQSFLIQGTLRAIFSTLQVRVDQADITYALAVQHFHPPKVYYVQIMSGNLSGLLDRQAQKTQLGISILDATQLHHLYYLSSQISDLHHRHHLTQRGA